jgi:hypothetical protein
MNEDERELAYNCYGYRGEFPTWSATFEVRYNASVLFADQITNLFNVAGFGVGIGEWRPQKNCSFGRFHVEVDAESTGVVEELAS